MPQDRDLWLELEGMMKLTVIWFVPPPLALIAQARGFNAARGLEVVSLVTQGSDQQYDALASGGADAAIAAMDNILMWNRRGAMEDVRIVAQMEAATGFILMARSGLTRLGDLVGAELLVDSAQNGFAIVLRAMMQEAGIQPDQYRMTVVGGVRERLDALIGGQGDATLLATFVEGVAQAHGCTALARVDDRYPGFPGQGLATRTGKLDQTGPALAAWLDALHEARLWAAQHPAEARHIVADAGFPEPVVDTLLAGVPGSFVPSRHGLEMLMAQRRNLGLPGADGDVSLLLDDRLLRTGL